MSFDWSVFGSAITGAVLGGLITGDFALKSTKKAHDNQLKQAARNEEKLVQGLLQAIHDEIETVFERYQETMGAKLESLKDGEALLLYYPLVSDFFTVYNGNSFLIGRIPDNDLRKQIIKTYTLAKAMVDSFRMNNDMNQKLEYWHQVFQESKNQIHQQKAAAQLIALIEYAKTLKTSHQQVKAEITQLLRALRKHGVLSEK
jgi:predicted deacylase